MSQRLLIVDDDQAMRELLQKSLAASGYQTCVAEDARGALAQLDSSDFDAVITDLRMPGQSGIELCAQIVANRPDVPVIVMTAFGSMDTAIEAIRAGAFDFIPKPFELDGVRLTLERALRHRMLTRRVERLAQSLHQSDRMGDLLGTSPAMRHVYEMIERVAPTSAVVLLSGESGTGKELVARAIHRGSPQRKGPLVAVNCAAMPATLLESELFGHTRGAFTDAHHDKQGLFLRAGGGTLFLDEIGELPLPLQPKLLRALQERTVRPIGRGSELPFDARVIAATNRRLEDAIAEGHFRRDLYYRINVIEIELPPLRSRGSDVLLLAQHFLHRAARRGGKEISGILPAAADLLLAYDWPGNVRELENYVERAVILCRRTELGPQDLPSRLRQRPHTDLASADDSDVSSLLSMDEIERRYVMRVFELTGHNKALTAKILGFNRKTLYRKLARFQARPGAEHESSMPARSR